MDLLLREFIAEIDELNLNSRIYMVKEDGVV